MEAVSLSLAPSPAPRRGGETAAPPAPGRTTEGLCDLPAPDVVAIGKGRGWRECLGPIHTPPAPIHSAPEVMFAWLAVALPDKGASEKQGGGKSWPGLGEIFALNAGNAWKWGGGGRDKKGPFEKGGGGGNWVRGLAVHGAVGAAPHSSQVVGSYQHGHLWPALFGY